jgi:hypothetical protein
VNAERQLSKANQILFEINPVPYNQRITSIQSPIYSPEILYLRNKTKRGIRDQLQLPRTSVLGYSQPPLRGSVLVQQLLAKPLWFPRARISTEGPASGVGSRCQNGIGYGRRLPGGTYVMNPHQVRTGQYGGGDGCQGRTSPASHRRVDSVI